MPPITRIELGNSVTSSTGASEEIHNHCFGVFNKVH